MNTYSPAEAMRRIDTLLSHVWMVRTFVKHSEEAEDFPELMGMVRAVFDTARALETRVGDPTAYVKMLSKKLGKVRAAAAQFRLDAAEASTHTNFEQAVISIEACVDEWQRLLDTARTLHAAAKSREPPPPPG